MRIGFMHERGNRSAYSYLYSFVNSVPDLSKVLVPNLLPTTGWSIIAADSQGNGARASKVLDKNSTTIWHTPWSSEETPQPHYFFVHIRANRSLKGLAYRNCDNLNGTMKEINIYSSTMVQLGH